MLDIFIDICGIVFIVFGIVGIIVLILDYIAQLLKKQKRIKCLCHHEYEQHSAFHCNGVVYEFKCRKCGKIISVKTVTKDKFNWIKDI